MSLDVSSSGALAASLDKCTVRQTFVIDPGSALTAQRQDSNEPAFNTLVRIMATRCMLSAEYFCSGSVSSETFGHYGLASSIYTHFTSPIRRYAGEYRYRHRFARSTNMAIRCTCPSPAFRRHRLFPPSRLLAHQIACRTGPGRCKPKAQDGTDGRPSKC